MLSGRRHQEGCAERHPADGRRVHQDGVLSCEAWPLGQMSSPSAAAFLALV